MNILIFFYSIHTFVPPSPWSNFRTFLSLPKKPCTCQQSFPISPQICQPWATTNLLSISADLPILDISYKWNIQSMDICVWLHSLSIMFSKFHLCHTINWDFIPFHGQITCHCLHIAYVISLLNSWGTHVASTFVLLWMTLLWKLISRFLCGHMFSLLWGPYLEGNSWVTWQACI